MTHFYPCKHSETWKSCYIDMFWILWKDHAATRMTTSLLIPSEMLKKFLPSNLNSKGVTKCFWLDLSHPANKKHTVLQWTDFCQATPTHPKPRAARRNAVFWGRLVDCWKNEILNTKYLSGLAVSKLTLWYWWIWTYPKCTRPTNRKTQLAWNYPPTNSLHFNHPKRCLFGGFLTFRVVFWATGFKTKQQKSKLGIVSSSLQFVWGVKVIPPQQKLTTHLKRNILNLNCVCKSWGDVFTRRLTQPDDG